MDSGDEQTLEPSNAQDPPKAKEPPPHMEAEDLKQFVKDYLQGAIFTDRQVKTMELLPMVFMPIVFGALEDVDLKLLGCIWEHTHKAGPRSVNGCPIFTSCRLMHRDDWDRAVVAINRELERLRDIEV